MKQLKNIIHHPLARNFFVYSFGALFLKGISFLLLPLYTKLLSPAEYGTLDLLSTYSSILDVSLSLGLLTVVMIEYYHFDETQRNHMFRKVLSIFLSVSSVLYTLALLVAFLLRDKLFPGVHLSMLTIVAATSYFTFFQSFVVLVLKQHQKAGLVTLLQVLSGSLSIGLNVLFVYGWSMGVNGIIWSTFIGVMVFMIYNVYYMVRHIHFKYELDWATTKQYLKLGLPFVPNALALWLMTSANRWILLNYTNLDEVGYFSVAFKFSSLFDPLIIQPFLGAYTPRVLNAFKEGNRHQPLRRIAIIGFVGFIAAGFAMQFVAKTMVDPSFYSALILIPVLVFANYFSLMAQVSAYLLVYNKRVLQMVSAITLGAACGVIANFILVPKLGGLGSAIAANVGGLVWFIAIYFLQHRERVKMAAHEHRTTA